MCGPSAIRNACRRTERMRMRRQFRAIAIYPGTYFSTNNVLCIYNIQPNRLDKNSINIMLWLERKQKRCARMHKK